MKLLTISILLCAFYMQNTNAIECYGCEIFDKSEECDFTYKCPKSTEYCETLISKVNGNYSIVLSCASKEMCSADPVTEGGLENCLHSKSNTECYSCCKDEDNCNTLESALLSLPKNAMKKPVDDKKKLATMIKKIEDDEESDDSEEKVAKKPNKMIAKTVDDDDDELPRKSSNKTVKATKSENVDDDDKDDITKYANYEDGDVNKKVIVKTNDDDDVAVKNNEGMEQVIEPFDIEDDEISEKNNTETKKNSTIDENIQNNVNLTDDTDVKLNNSGNSAVDLDENKRNEDEAVDKINSTDNANNTAENNSTDDGSSLVFVKLFTPILDLFNDTDDTSTTNGTEYEISNNTDSNEEITNLFEQNEFTSSSSTLNAFSIPFILSAIMILFKLF